MPKHRMLTMLILLALLAGPGPVQGEDGGTTLYLPVILTPLGAPVLQWAYGGCYSSWCETGWYSSPAAADVNNDGVPDVIASAYSLFALDGSDGHLIWRAGGTSHRTWPGVAVADLDRDNQAEIVVAQGGGYVSAYRLDGTLKWQKHPGDNSGELRGLLLADLDGNGGNLEVVVTRASGSAVNTWVLDASGNTRSGWPQLSGSNGYAWGVYNDNAAAADISGDGRLELIVPSDVHYINAYEPDGTPLPANNSVYPGKYWGQVGVWESLTPELRGWGACNGVRAESYRTNFADGPASIADLNGDGSQEVVVTGNMYDCNAGYPPSRYMAVYVFNADRTRFNQDGYNWNTIPVDTGAPLSESYEIIESAEPNPVLADLDGDGNKEILYASYDGRLHAFWLDKTEHGVWPYAVTPASGGAIRFASEPAVVDIDNDGSAEVIFTSWAQKGSHLNGKLHILNASGSPIHEIDLPAPRSSSDDWNGAMAAPTLANIDSDPDLEVIVNTANAGVVVYNLPGSANARILWGTGRGSYLRAGTP